MTDVDLSDSRTNWRTALQQKLASRRGAQVQFARDIECSESHLSLVLKGKRNPSYALAQKISGKTRIPIDRLMAPPLAPIGDVQ
ncbi:hypothetical protein ACRAVF_27030 [Bradyrhizobium oligotrophicum S58]